MVRISVNGLMNYIFVSWRIIVFFIYWFEEVLIFGNYFFCWSNNLYDSLLVCRILYCGSYCLSKIGCMFLKIVFW